jgi:uncharacterized protein YqfA (UPF0365 family)
MAILLLNTLTIVITITVVITVLTIGAIFYFIPINLWITALFSGVYINIGQLIGMRLRRVPPALIVNELIKSHKAKLDDVTFSGLETHYLAKGNITTVIDALIAARNADIRLDYAQAAAIDLAGRDVLQAVRDSVNTKVIDSQEIEAVAQDGIQLIVKARITVRAHIDKLIGGAGEETVAARVGQGIVAAIGSAELHTEVLGNPRLISDQILVDGLTAGTAYDVLSIDIADIDVGKNIGATLRVEEAGADLKYAQAKAEERRANAVAEEQHFKARVQEMKAKLIEAEAQVPLAISDAFRIGHLGVMDYYRLQNMDADTKMRRSFSELEEETETGLPDPDSPKNGD